MLKTFYKNTDYAVCVLLCLSLKYLLRAATMESSSDEEDVRTFVQVISEKYNPENFPYGQGIGVVVLPSPPGSPIKGKRWCRVTTTTLIVLSKKSRHPVKFLNVLKSVWRTELRSVILFADRLFLPSILVVNDCGITKAGDKSDIAIFCAHVVELDLSHNQLQDWGEVGVLHTLGVW